MLPVMYFVVLIFVAAFLAARAARLKLRHRPSFRIYAAAFGLVVGYLFAEFAATVYYGFSWSGASFIFFDESGKTVHFDPLRGYLLTAQPSRWCRITNGTIEWVAWLKGNSQGFPTRTDFNAARTAGSTRRIAVFGDSFSAGDFLETNWPDRTQALAEAGAKKLQLLNFSLDAVGLANWWSIITGLVAPQNYALDGIVFVVFESDLERKFSVADHRHYLRENWRRCRNWDPQTYPTTLEQTEACAVAVGNTYVISDREFTQVLNKQWPPSVARPLRSTLGRELYEYLDDWRNSRRESYRKFSGFDPQQAHLIEDIRLFVSSRKLLALVVYLPRRERLMNSTWENDPYRAETQAFAKDIGARFVDGSGAFANMQPADIRKCFFPYDGHWNQRGSDRFAKFMLDLIRRSFSDRLQAFR